MGVVEVPVVAVIWMMNLLLLSGMLNGANAT